MPPSCWAGAVPRHAPWCGSGGAGSASCGTLDSGRTDVIRPHSCGVNDVLNTASSSSHGRARLACVNMVDEVGKVMTGVGQDMNRMPGMRRGRERRRIRGRRLILGSLDKTSNSRQLE